MSRNQQSTHVQTTICPSIQLSGSHSRAGLDPLSCVVNFSTDGEKQAGGLTEKLVWNDCQSERSSGPLEKVLVGQENMTDGSRTVVTRVQNDSLLSRSAYRMNSANQL